jgi:hypothetical protein
MDKAMHSEFVGPIWTNAEKEKPEHNVSVLVFIPEEDEHITTGMWDISNKWVLLDEYRVPTAQVTYWRPMVEKPSDKKYTPTFNHNENDTTDKIIRNIQKENQSLRSELQKQKELNAELVAGLSKLTQRIRLMMINMGYNPEQDEFFVGIESLIKKSKES